MNSQIRQTHSDSGMDVTLESLKQAIDRPLNDAMITYSKTNQQWALFHGNTLDRNIHGALGDNYEGYKLSILEWNTATDKVQLAFTITLEGSSRVYEGLAPMWADINGDGTDDILTTVSTKGKGAQLRAYLFEANDSGSYQVANEAQSSYIGTDDRWLHQLGVGPLGPNGEIEIVQVLKPHLTGLVRYHRLDPSSMTLVEVHEVPDRSMTTHEFGSRNLDTVTIGDFNNDGIPEVVLTDFLETKLVGLQRTSNEDVKIDQVWCISIPEGEEVETNLAASCGAESTETPEIVFSTHERIMRIRFEASDNSTNTTMRDPLDCSSGIRIHSVRGSVMSAMVVWTAGVLLIPFY